MLVLGVRQDECVFLGDNITVKLLDIRGDNVRLGFDAPEDIVILREAVAKARAESLAPDSGEESAQGGATGESRSPSR